MTISESATIISVLTLYDGELYMNYSDKEGYHLAAYHMETGRYREVKKQETEYRLMEWGWGT